MYNLEGQGRRGGGGGGLSRGRCGWVGGVGEGVEEENRRERGE